MITVIPGVEGGYRYRLFAKGYPQGIIPRCSYKFGKDGKLETLTNEMKDDIANEIVKPMECDGLRAVVIAYKDVVARKQEENEVQMMNGEPDWDAYDEEDEILNGLTLIAILGMEIPILPGVTEAIKACQRSGITVRMVTGDNISTARSIAKKCGILNPNPGDEENVPVIREGKDFNSQIRDGSWDIQQNLIDEALPPLRVLAGSSPLDKYNLVKGIINSKVNENGEVVAIFGGGLNDYPALMKADVGFGMGIVAGSVKANEAPDIILLGGNVWNGRIVESIFWGRYVDDCVAKFVQFRFTMLVVILLLQFIGGLLISTRPIKAVQLLWMQIVFDIIVPLAFVAEQPTQDLLSRKPNGRTKSIISGKMMKNMVGLAIYQFIVLMWILFYGHFLLGVDDLAIIAEPSVHRATIFNTFVLMTLFNQFNALKIDGERNVFRGISSNPVFCCVWVLSVGALIVTVQFGGHVFSTVPLDLEQWMWCLVPALGTLLWGQVVANIPFPRSRSKNTMVPVQSNFRYHKYKSDSTIEKYFH